MTKVLVALPLLLFALALALPCHAATLGYTLSLSTPTDNHNLPFLRLTNDSTAAEIIDFRITIGKPAFNYDDAIFESFSPGIAFTQFTPDDNGSGGLRADEVHYSFTGFGPGAFFRFRVDVDPDSDDVTEDYRIILFDLGGANPNDNALVTVAFTGGAVLSGQLQDFAANAEDVYTFSQSVDAQAVPAAASLVLFGLGGIALALALGLLAAAKGAVHEIEALILVLIATVLGSAAALVRAVDRLRVAQDASAAVASAGTVGLSGEVEMTVIPGPGPRGGG